MRLRTVDNPKGLAFQDTIMAMPNVHGSNAIALPAHQDCRCIHGGADETATRVVYRIDIIVRESEFARINCYVVARILGILDRAQQ